MAPAANQSETYFDDVVDNNLWAAAKHEHCQLVTAVAAASEHHPRPTVPYLIYWNGRNNCDSCSVRMITCY